MSQDDGWGYSREGDLDPDLAEEAGYARWDPAPRRGWPLAYRVVLATVIVALLLPLVLAALR